MFFPFKARCMCGQVETADRMMTAIAMDMLLRCGRFRSIQRSTMAEQPCTTSPVHQLSPRHSAMAEATIQKQVRQFLI